MILHIIQWPEDFFWSNRLQVAVWYQPNREMTILSCFIALHNKNNMMLIKLDHWPGDNRTQQNIGTTFWPTFSQPSSSPSSSTSPSSLRARYLFYTIIESTHLIRFSNITGNDLILLDCKIFSQDMTTWSSYPNWSLFIQKLLNHVHICREQFLWERKGKHFLAKIQFWENALGKSCSQSTLWTIPWPP